MIEQLTTFIESLKEDKRIASFDEAATKQAIVLRLLSILDWDTFNIDEVSPEYSVGGKKVDYSLRVGSGKKVFVEVKKIGEELENHQQQLLNYAFQEGVKLAILTNGITWWFYLPLHEGSWEQRRFYTIDVLQQETEEIVSKFIDFLSKENIASGVAIQNAETTYKSYKKQNILEETLPQAWNKIISDGDETFIEFISETTEKLCGYKPDSEMVDRFISKNKDRLLISVVPPTKIISRTIPKATRAPVSIPSGTSGEVMRLDLLQYFGDGEVAVHPSRPDGIDFLLKYAAWGWVRTKRQPNFLALYVASPHSSVLYIGKIREISGPIADRTHLERLGFATEDTTDFKPGRQIIYLEQDSIRELKDPIPMGKKGSHVRNVRYTTMSKIARAKTTEDLW